MRCGFVRRAPLPDSWLIRSLQGLTLRKLAFSDGYPILVW